MSSSTRPELSFAELDLPQYLQETLSKVGYAHANGLQVHPYTFRADAGQVPAYANSFEHMLELFYVNAEVDGVFTDFTDRAVAYLRGH